MACLFTRRVCWVAFCFDRRFEDPGVAFYSGIALSRALALSSGRGLCLMKSMNFHRRKWGLLEFNVSFFSHPLHSISHPSVPAASPRTRAGSRPAATVARTTSYPATQPAHERWTIVPSHTLPFLKEAFRHEVFFSPLPGFIFAEN